MKTLFAGGLFLVASFASGQNCTTITTPISVVSGNEGAYSSAQQLELGICHFRGVGPQIEYYIDTVPGTFCSSPYYYYPTDPSRGYPWIMKRESRPLRNYAKNPGEWWATIDKHFQEQPTMPMTGVPPDSLMHFFYCYPEQRKLHGDEAKP